MTDNTQQDKRVAFGSAIKALGDNRVGGYLVKFTDANRRDLYGEWFDAKTEYRMEDFPVLNLPTLFHHGMDATIKAHGIGRVVKAEIDDKGIWIEAKLKEADEYTEWVKQLMESGELGWSSGALPQAVRVADSGHIDEWPIIEASMTHTPAMPVDTRVTSLRSLAPPKPREAQQPRGVTVSTSGGTVTNVNIEFANDVAARASPANTQTNNANHTHTGEIEVSELKERLAQKAAIKMLDDESREEVIALIEEYVSMAMDEMKMQDGDVDEDATAAADEEVLEEVADAIEEESKSSEGDEMRAFINKPQFGQSVVEAWLRGYMQAREQKQAQRREVIRNAMNNTQRNVEGTSKKSQAGGHHSNDAPGSANIQVSEDLRYARLTGAEMALGVKMMLSAIPSVMRKNISFGQLVSEDYIRHTAHKIAAHMDKGGFKDVGDNVTMRKLSPFRSFKADEINASDITAQGTEWVTTYYDNTIWERVRDETKLFDLLLSKDMRTKEIPPGASSVQFQTDVGSGTVYYRAEANDLVATTNDLEITAYPTAFGTGNVTINAREHVLTNIVTDVLDEDSIINAVQFADRDMLVTMAEALEDAIINGDTTSDTTNINHDGAALQTAPQRELWRAWDGLRHHWLIDNTSLSSDHATGALAATTFLDTRNLLPGAVRNRRGNLLFVMDYSTEAKARQIAELFTRDVAYNDATFFTGVLPPVDGIEVYTSGFLRLADTDGKVTDGGNVTDTGTLMCIYAPYWAYASKRAISVETARGWRGAESGATLLVATVRHGFGARSVNAAAGTYNISVA